jgi:hypothetical protein
VRGDVMMVYGRIVRFSATILRYGVVFRSSPIPAAECVAAACL